MNPVSAIVQLSEHLGSNQWSMGQGGASYVKDAASNWRR